jgi:hypothetical protein
MKKYAIPASALAIVAVLVAAPTAASASTLPDGQSMYGYQGGFYGINAADAALTPIGPSTAFGNGTYGMDYSDQDGVAYFFVDSTPCEFYSLDITTGIETDIGPIVDGATDSDNCDALDVAPDGTVYVGSVDTVYEIDTTNGSASAAHVLSGDALDGQMGWLATDPTTGILYVGDYNGNIFSLNTTTWAATIVASGVGYIESGDFDANGVFWFSGSGPDTQGLNSLLLSDPTNVTSYGSFADGGGGVSIFALFVQGGTAAPKPALAATGSDNGVLLPLGVGASILLLAGAGAILVARRRATT